MLGNMTKRKSFYFHFSLISFFLEANFDFGFSFDFVFSFTLHALNVL